MRSPISSVTAPIISPVLGERLRTPQHPMARFFRNNEPGAWYDPSDLSTLFQDDAGTVPVTGPEQPVGLMLDKSGNGYNAIQQTATKRPILRGVTGAYYLDFDGVDDYLYAPGFDMSSADKVAVITGANKLSDVSHGVVYELSETSLTPGSFGLFAPVAPATSYQFRSRGSEYAAVGTGSDQFPAPTKNIVTGISNISAPTIIIRVDAAQVSSNNNNQGVGKYASDTLYIGMRGGVSNPFSGHIYGLTIGGNTYPIAMIESAERYLMNKMGIT